MDTKTIIIGTAGHIDHGKTALVKALTGIDTDRLKEEKERGITIELGFAHLSLPSGQQVGVVDVPGHERFVKNMVAGAMGMDLVVLVVAADEGIMPQTTEHLEICQLLGVKKGLVVLTKKDLVEQEWLEMVLRTSVILSQVHFWKMPLCWLSPLPPEKVLTNSSGSWMRRYQKWCQGPRSDPIAFRWTGCSASKGLAR